MEAKQSSNFTRDVAMIYSESSSKLSSTSSTGSAAMLLRFKQSFIFGNGDAKLLLVSALSFLSRTLQLGSLVIGSRRRLALWAALILNFRRWTALGHLIIVVVSTKIGG